MQARVLARQNRRAAAEARPRDVQRWRTAAEESPSTGRAAEVRAKRFAGEAAARLLCRHADEDAEQQARSCLQRVEQRRARLGLGRSSASLRLSPSGGSLLVGRDLSEDLSKTWVWSRDGASVESLV